MPSKPSRRAIRNTMAFFGGATELETAPARKKTGRQKESTVNDAVQEWARYRNGVLFRNRRGMVDLPSGGKMPFGLGPNGYGDVVGYLTITVTPAMLNKRIAVYCMVESKFDPKVGPEPHQQKYIDEVRDAGGISGCAHNALDCEEMLSRYLEKVAADER